MVSAENSNNINKRVNDNDCNQGKDVVNNNNNNKRWEKIQT